MISSAISADLGRQELIQGSSEALATVTGIVDGTGSIGAAVGQVSERRGLTWSVQSFSRWRSDTCPLGRSRWHSCAVVCCTESPGFSPL